MTLHDKDGGHHVHRGVVFPIEREQDDQPIATPEAVEDALAWAAAIAVTALAFISWLLCAAGLPLDFPFN